MKTFRVAKACEPTKLHEELQAVGIPVVTVRASHAQAGEPAMYAVVVVQDKASEAAIKKVLSAHKTPGKCSRTPNPAQMESALKQVEKL